MYTHIHQGKKTNIQAMSLQKKKAVRKVSKFRYSPMLNFTRSIKHLVLLTVLFLFGHLNVITQETTTPFLVIGDLFGAFTKSSVTSVILTVKSQ